MNFNFKFNCLNRIDLHKYLQKKTNQRKNKHVMENGQILIKLKNLEISRKNWKGKTEKLKKAKNSKIQQEMKNSKKWNKIEKDWKNFKKKLKKTVKIEKMKNSNNIKKID